MDGFSVEENMKKLTHARENMKAADLVTCTTGRCANYVTRETGRSDVHVFPNCIDFSDWRRLNSPKMTKSASSGSPRPATSTTCGPSPPS
jgi:hypothetical protein